MSHTEPPPSPKATARQGPSPPEASAKHDHGSLLNPDVAHEASDVNLRALVSLAVGLFVVTAVVLGLMYGLFSYFNRQAAKNDPPVSPLARPLAELPRSTTGNPFFGPGPGPQLLTHEPGVLAKQRTMEQEVLDSYGWVDQKSAIARMPISEAKKLILQRGLPARGDEVDPSLGTRRAAFGESSSGRTIPAGRKKEEVTKEEATPAPAPTHKEHEK